MADLHDLAAAYVVDALAADERVEYERHLAGCQECQQNVTRLREPVDAMVDALAQQPSPTTRDAVLKEIAITPQLGRPAPVTQLAPQRNRLGTWALGFAAVVLAVLAGTVFLQLRNAQEVESIITAADAETVVLQGDGIEGRFTYSTTERRGVFVSASLPDVSPQETYQLWLIDADGPSPAGLFTPDAGEAVVVVSDVAPGLTLGLTVEPEGGSLTPTSEVLLQAELGA